MNENKTKYIILGVIIGILLIITISVYIISKNKENNINKEIVKLDNNNYFLVQNLINNYYSDNLEEKNLNSPSFVCEDIYYNDDKIINYYFVNGYLIDRDFEGEFTYLKNIKFLLIIKNNYYKINELDSNINLLEYAKNYDIANISVNENVVPSYNLSIENKLIYYIAVFKDLLEVDPEKAYGMLGNVTKEKYSNYNDFYKERFDILINLSTYINGYNIDNNKYSIIDNNYKKTTIIENAPMHFQIDF